MINDFHNIERPSAMFFRRRQALLKQGLLQTSPEYPLYFHGILIDKCCAIFSLFLSNHATPAFDYLGCPSIFITSISLYGLTRRHIWKKQSPCVPSGVYKGSQSLRRFGYSWSRWPFTVPLNIFKYRKVYISQEAIKFFCYFTTRPRQSPSIYIFRYSLQ